jgi:2-succinyl-5-enolpyruvyl-6-hydroxy-3-cyclohexene-1-carboxylate synthase
MVLEPGPRTVVVAGDDAGPPARVLAQDAGWPLLAEPSSGSRTGANALRCYRLLLAGPLGREIERVVVCGHPTISRPVTELLQRSDVEVVSVPPRGWWAERPFPVDSTATAVAVAGPDDPAWLDRWRDADREVSAALDRLLAAEAGITPHEVAGAVSAAVPPSGLLYVGASSPIRDLDLMVAPYAVGDRRRVVANRGLAGIDGTISSAIGAALARPHGTRNLALMGDVTFLHDSNGLVLGPDEARPDLTIVVVNDDGGSIFAMLEQGDAAYADRYDKLFGTPHGVDVASLCAATRTPHWKVGSLPELNQALASPNGGIEVVEVAVRRDDRRDLDARIRALVTDGR